MVNNESRLNGRDGSLVMWVVSIYLAAGVSGNNSSRAFWKASS